MQSRARERTYKLKSLATFDDLISKDSHPEITVTSTIALLVVPRLHHSVSTLQVFTDDASAPPPKQLLCFFAPPYLTPAFVVSVKHLRLITSTIETDLSSSFLLFDQNLAHSSYYSYYYYHHGCP